MKHINFSEEHLDEKGNDFSFKFEGLIDETLDIEEIENKLHDFAINDYHEDMQKNVVVLRTILEKCTEQLLVIFYNNEERKENVQYEDKNLVLFSLNELEYSFKYSSNNDGSKIDFSFNDDKKDIIDYPYSEKTLDTMNNILKKIYTLKYSSTFVLDDDSKKLIEFYKLFYNENPDFKDELCNIKIQSMIAILSNFEISLANEYYFSVLPSSDISTSIKLSKLVNKLYPLGKIEEKEYIKISDDIKEKIKIIGEKVREYINDGYDKKSALINISKIACFKKNVNPSHYDVDSIAVFLNSSKNEVNSGLNLVKRLEQQINVK